jgi:hypothetical protein
MAYETTGISEAFCSVTARLTAYEGAVVFIHMFTKKNWH